MQFLYWAKCKEQRCFEQFFWFYQQKSLVPFLPALFCCHNHCHKVVEQKLGGPKKAVNYSVLWAYHAFNLHFEGYPAQATADLLPHWSSFSRWGSGWKTLGRPNSYDSGEGGRFCAPKNIDSERSCPKNMRPWWYQDRDLKLSIKGSIKPLRFYCEALLIVIRSIVWGAKTQLGVLWVWQSQLARICQTSWTSCIRCIHSCWVCWTSRLGTAVLLDWGFVSFDSLESDRIAGEDGAGGEFSDFAAHRHTAIEYDVQA